MGRRGAEEFSACASPPLTHTLHWTVRQALENDVRQQEQEQRPLQMLLVGCHSAVRAFSLRSNPMSLVGISLGDLVGGSRWGISLEVLVGGSRWEISLGDLVGDLVGIKPDEPRGKPRTHPP